MRQKSFAAAMVLALGLSLPNVAEAASAPDVDFPEAPTGITSFDYEASTDVVDRRWLIVRDIGADDYIWFDTRHGSRFYLDFCTPQGERFFERVSRAEFLRRLTTSSNLNGLYVYDADRNRGRFQLDIDERAGEYEDDCDAPVREP